MEVSRASSIQQIEKKMEGRENAVQNINMTEYLNNDENCIALNWRIIIEQIEKKMEGGETVTAVK